MRPRSTSQKKGVVPKICQRVDTMVRKPGFIAHKMLAKGGEGFLTWTGSDLGDGLRPS